MHEGLSGNLQESSKLNVRQEIVAAADIPEPIKERLETAFPVLASDLAGRRRALAVSLDFAGQLASRLRAVGELQSLAVPGVWNEAVDPHSLSGTMKLLSGRQQYFVLHLDTFGQHLVLRCVSPVGRLDNGEMLEEVKRISRGVPEQLGIIEEADDRGIDLTVEEEVLLGDPGLDAARVSWLVTRVTAAADRFEQALWEGRDSGIELFRAGFAAREMGR